MWCGFVRMSAGARGVWKSASDPWKQLQLMLGPTLVLWRVPTPEPYSPQLQLNIFFISF